MHQRYFSRIKTRPDRILNPIPPPMVDTPRTRRVDTPTTPQLRSPLGFFNPLFYQCFTILQNKSNQIECKAFNPIQALFLNQYRQPIVRRACVQQTVLRRLPFTPQHRQNQGLFDNHHARV
jgi:hypothetical protein